MTNQENPIIITPELVADTVRTWIPRLACEVSPDILAAYQAAAKKETNERARFVFSQLLENAQIACTSHTPLCQDTGTVWVLLELGPDAALAGNPFALANEAVAEAYREAKLRLSVVRDALIDRSNTQTNTPAFCEIHFVDTPHTARLSLMLKGGGSDNASAVFMLSPGEGKEGIVRAVLKQVQAKAANACPPLIVGVGVGATFDKVAGLAKRALLRPEGMPHPDERVACFEAQLLGEVNALGIGPAALGGATTALDVHVETAACHIAALPVAINLGCSATRRVTIDLLGGRSNWEA